jgi:alpha/beta hydrolase fold
MQVFYCISVVYSIAITATAFSTAPMVAAIPSKHRANFAFISTLVTEFSHLILLLKLAILFSLYNQSWWNESTWVDFIYGIDILTHLVLFAIFLQSYFARHQIYERTKMFRDRTSTEAPAFNSLSFFFRFCNPIWTCRGLKKIENISYANSKEKDGVQKRYLKHWKIDVLHHASFPKQRPVVIYIHSGNEDETPPFLLYLAMKKYVVVQMSYRPLPKWTPQDQIIDAKRVIRWTKENIEVYGGDLSFISVCGGSNGGYLALMMAVTPNDPKYQPGFESVDTKIQACVAVSAIYDVTKKSAIPFQPINDDEAKEASPYWRVTDIQNRSLLQSSREEDVAFPPIMVNLSLT